MTEREGYEILCRPYIRTGEVGKILGVTSSAASQIMIKKKVRRIARGMYVTADFIKKFELESYWKQVSRFADRVE